MALLGQILEPMMETVADRAKPTAIRTDLRVCFVGIEPIKVANHVSIAGQSGEDVEAFSAGRRYRRHAGTNFRA